MARSLSQMLIAQADPAAGQDAFTQAQQGVRSGIQLATIEQELDEQRIAAQTQKLQAENAKVNFMQTGFNRIATASSPAAAKRRAKQLEISAKRAGIFFDPEFLAESVERQADLQMISQGLGNILADPNVSVEDRSKIIGESLQIIGQEDGFSKAFSTVQNIQQAQARTEERVEVREERREQKLSTNLVKAQNDFEKRVKGEKQRLEGVGTIKGLLESGGAISQNVAQFQIARLAQGAGVLTDKDISRLGGSRALTNRVESFVDTIVAGKPLTPSDTKELLEIVNLFDTRLNEQIQTKAQSFAEGRGKALRQSAESILEVLNVAPQAAPVLAQAEQAPGEAAPAQSIKSVFANFLRSRNITDISQIEALARAEGIEFTSADIESLKTAAGTAVAEPQPTPGISPPEFP